MMWQARYYGCGGDLRCRLFDIGITPDHSKSATAWRVNAGQLRLKAVFPDVDAAKRAALLFVRKELEALSTRLNELGAE